MINVRMADGGDMLETFKVPLNLSDPKQETDAIQDNNKTELEKKKSDSKKSVPIVPLPYKEPEWAGIAPKEYNFEVIKSGTSVSTVNFETSYIVFGRLEICDVTLEHPSVSRYHAIVQYCRGDEEHQKGFYLYDLGSTHGTFLNKEKINAKIYYKLKVGYIVKFGGSTRLHVFQGPEEPEEEVKSKVVPVKIEEDICGWGIAEDAEEEDDLSENPFALATPNESTYIDDPKKTLRGWFEREGYELEYEVEEKGHSTFVSRVKLPIDNPTGDYVTIEACVSGKKKEAVAACALEACRTLDRYGVLRQSNQESRKQKQKKWEENDYYDSDDDTYLDRTGAIEKKREIRKKMEKKPDAETFQTLEVKHKSVVEEIEEINERLAASMANAESETRDMDEDSLEKYMASLNNVAKAPADKVEKTRLKFRLNELEKERSRLEKLLDITRPAKLPPVVKHPGIVGKKVGKKVSLPKVKPAIEIKAVDDRMEEEEDDDDVVTEKSSLKSEKDVCEEISKKCESPKAELQETNVIEKSAPENDKPVQDSKTNKRVIGPEMPEQRQHVKKSKNRKTKEKVDIYTTNNEDYSTWVPPVNQTGDGITHLNAKFGY